MSWSNLSKMNFEVSEEQKNFLNKVDRVCKSIRDYETRCYLDEKINDRVIPEFGEIGMLGCPISKKYGGLGYDILTYLFALERIGREGNSLRTFFSAHVSIGQMVIQNWGNAEQKQKYLVNTTNGTNIMGFALTEPDAGSDPGRMSTKFEERGDNYVLNGTKHWVGNGTFAKVITTYAKGPDGKISAFIVDTNSKGFSSEEMKNKMGLLTVKNAEITFENCLVPKENLLGKLGSGLSVAYSALIDGRLSVAAGAVGVMKDCLDESIKYSQKREQHGSVLAKKQLIQEHIATMIVNIESSRWLVYRAGIARQRLHDYVENLKENDANWMSSLNRQNTEYSALRNRADRLAAIAKLHATNAAFDCANRAVQVFGSYGYQKTSRVARHFLDSRAIVIYEGANEVLKLKIASLEMGEKYDSY
ncbi:putative acyl-CoA dehydrogenase [Nitrosotalea sinensis]|uniref:Putative acyl-CoA dehydrogenase n=1 Tax=Nitrosotalea sinensis TaxID=1499975 RepID=A0A2H1EJL7_9ARCH|nr:acyl-CoA dehydrogenase family protein [Candidatus Nitrosotalea sinensis]SHO48045.1 putative acyl-CoA dehydrogenase [Candidatus Nitrosotalea sinensis]